MTHRWTILSVIACSLATLARPALSQQVPYPIPDLPEAVERESPVETGIFTTREVQRPETAFLTDRAVDRDAYIVGPNDQLSIAIMGYSDAFYQVEVSADGSVLVPKVGGIPVGGLTLEQVEGRIRARAQGVYPAADVDVTLSKPRVFKVYVLGDVPDPGARAASPLTRVSELMPERAGEREREGAGERVGGRAGERTVERELEREDRERRQIRNVFLIRAPGDTVSVDLAAFRQTGELRFNPTLREGDIVLVPGRDEIVPVHGRVFFPGEYEYRPGESLAELLRVANGGRGFPSDAHDVIEVTRFVGKDDRRTLTFDRSEATGIRGEEFVLEPFDAVFVPSVSRYKVQRMATIEGEVLYPGTYPIRPDTTSVRDLIRMAGGLAPEASLVAARLTRSDIGAEEEGLRTLQQTPLEFLTEDERRILRVRETSDPDNVVIDLAELMAAGRESADVRLKDGDRLVIPEEREGVTVLGAVREPGIVRFDPGTTIDEYASRAGGYTERADEGDAVVLRAKLGTRLERDEVRSIESGDTIVVPFEKERDWWETFRSTSIVVTSLLSVVLSFIAATR